ETEAERFLAHAREAGRVAMVPAHEDGTLVGLGLSLPDGARGYLPLRHTALTSGVQLPPARAKALLAPLLADERVVKAGHGLKALMHMLAREGLPLTGARDDVELLSYLLNPSRREHALADLARERLQEELPTLATGKKTVPLSERTAEEVAAWAGPTADAARRLVEPLWEDLERAGLGKLARDIEVPLLPILARMEERGVKLDTSVLGRISLRVDSEADGMLKEIHRLAGHEFNVGSNTQLAQVLFVELKLPVLKRGKTGPSADQEVLEKLSETHPLPRAIIDYRTLSKLKSTYLDTLPGLVAADGRVHTTFNQVVAATGRLSSQDPNLQNIPIRTEVGREIRRAFVAEPGHKLVSADYSQVELRILAHIAEDAALLEAFHEDADVHQRTAAEIFGVPPGEVTSEMRRVAKTVNFGIAYGLSPHGLSARLGISQEEARGIIDRYFARYAGIRRYLDETVERARKVGYVETLFGRRRLMADLHSKNRAAAQAAERAAINMPIQGTAADLIKLAMIAVERALAEERLAARMILQVHDELLFEAPDSEVGRVEALARRCMSGVAELKVPLKVDVGAGLTWADAH
ncbi:MAG: DNA polymerase I, partial [Myxococcaceae bacterium]|nr:DNA polymerase I [Myxococcaceae bacterium]